MLLFCSQKRGIYAMMLSFWLSVSLSVHMSPFFLMHFEVRPARASRIVYDTLVVIIVVITSKTFTSHQPRFWVYFAASKGRGQSCDVIKQVGGSVLMDGQQASHRDTLSIYADAKWRSLHTTIEQSCHAESHENSSARAASTNGQTDTAAVINKFRRSHYVDNTL